MKVISSIDEETGDFFCSNESINRLQKNIRYSGFSNFLEIPTDCPQRDERLGWTGDISVFASTACFNFNMNRFLRKWLIDVKAQQTKDGGIPVVVPRVKHFGGTKITAGWSDCVFLVPWALYQNSGDKTILEKFYPMMKRYLSGVEKKAAAFSSGEDRYIWSHGFSYGDWCAPNENQKQWMAKRSGFQPHIMPTIAPSHQKLRPFSVLKRRLRRFKKSESASKTHIGTFFTDKKWNAQKRVSKRPMFARCILEW